MKVTDKKFWFYEIATTLCLSVFSLLMFADNVISAIVILLPNALAVAVGLLLSGKISIRFIWSSIWGCSMVAYFIEMFLMATFRISRLEPYPLIMGQYILMPLHLLESGLTCAIGWFIMNLTYKRSAFKAISRGELRN